MFPLASQTWPAPEGLRSLSTSSCKACADSSEPSEDFIMAPSWLLAATQLLSTAEGVWGEGRSEPLQRIAFRDNTKHSGRQARTVTKRIQLLNSSNYRNHTNGFGLRKLWCAQKLCNCVEISWHIHLKSTAGSYQSTLERWRKRPFTTFECCGSLWVPSFSNQSWQEASENPHLVQGRGWLQQVLRSLLPAPEECELPMTEWRLHSSRKLNNKTCPKSQDSKWAVPCSL